jgi:hypothetical protein
MGQISGVNTQSITSIAGIPVANISYVGPLSSAALGLGGGSKQPSSFPYTFIPGNDAAGAYFLTSGTVSENKILGNANVNDVNINTPTFQLKNFTSKFYNVEGSLNRYTISQWVKIDNFPRKQHNESIIRKKRTSISRYDFMSGGEGLTNGFIEFGAIAPYYRDIDNNYLYQYQVEPFSFGVCIGFDSGYMISLYTDYKFQLETWYMLTVEFTSENFNDPTTYKNVSMYVDNNKEYTGLFLGKPWSSKALQRNKRINNYNRTAGFDEQHLAVFPGFKLFNLDGLKATQTWNLLFNNFVNIYEMNYASFSPICGIVNNNINTTNAGVYNNFNITKLNSRINFGRIDISGGDVNIEELYSNTANQYPNKK